MNLLDDLKKSVRLPDIHHEAFMADQIFIDYKTFEQMSQSILLDIAYETILTDEFEIRDLCLRETNPILEDLHQFIAGGMSEKYFDMAIQSEEYKGYQQMLIEAWILAYIDAYKVIAKQVQKVREEEEKAEQAKKAKAEEEAGNDKK